MENHLSWLTQDLTEVPAGDDWLSERERELLAGLKFPKRRNDWRLGRWTAKCACRAYLPDIPTEMAGMEIIAADDGSPDVFYVESQPVPVSISISHSHDRGFCVIAPRDFAVGCDLEWIEHQSPDFFDDYFRPEETSFCLQAPGAIKPIAGYLIWSAKESCLKVNREGLRRDTRSIRIDVDFNPAESMWNTWTGQCMETSSVFRGWWRYEDRFIYTLASDRFNLTPEELRM